LVKQVDEWLNNFKRGEMSVEDQPRCGRTSTSRTDENVENVHHAVLADRRRTTDEISEITVVCHGVYTNAF
jgi:histone-lysine N-methyltransferase SETMAR